MTGAPVSYFRPTITIGANGMVDHSQVVGVVPILLMPANVERIGFILQSHSETNDLWWGYDENVSINGIGYFCQRGGDRKAYHAPTNGVWRGPIYAISDGGGRVTVKEWAEGS